MKRIISGIMMALLLVVMSGAARAEEEKVEGTVIKAGIKMWMNSWKREAPGTESMKSNNILLVGPSIEAELNDRFFVEASYLFSASDYKFTEAGVTTEFDRSDLDLALGTNLNRYVGAMIGYRNSAFKEKETGAKESLYGLFYSVRGSAPLNETISLYGKLTYLSTRFKAEGQAREEAPGWIAEAGIKYAFNKELTGDLGYKYETTKGKDSSIKDTFTGVTLGVMYAFE